MPRARGGMSLTTLPSMMTSPVVCLSSPAMMRRKVVLPQPEGPSSTMNSPSETDRLIPLTAATPPNSFFTSRVEIAAIAASDLCCSETTRAPGGASGADNGPAGAVNGSSRLPFLEDFLALLRRPFDRILRRHGAGRRLGHHVAEDEVVVDLVGRGPGGARISRHRRPFVGAFGDLELVRRMRSRIVAEDRHRLRHDVGIDRHVVAGAGLERIEPVVDIVLEE